MESAELIAWAHEHMSDHKVPRLVIVVDSPPVDGNGKVHKIALRARATGEEQP